MPAQPDDFEPTEADIDMVIEGAAGKLIKPENLTTAIASMRERITQLEAEKTKLLNQLDTATMESAASINQHLATLNSLLANAREQLTYYELLPGKQN